VEEFLPVTTPEELAHLFPREEFDIHKNSRGHLVVIGGSSLYSGAVLLAGESALRTGCGLVSCVLPEGMNIYAPVPKALMIRQTPGENGFFTSDSFSGMEDLMEKANALVVGPGMGRNPASFPFLEKLLLSGKKIVVDADALYFLSENPNLLHKAAAISTLFLTPHEGEARRLEKALALDSTLPRPERAVNLAKAVHAAIVLKGARSITASPTGEFSINLSGTNALATAGSGDVLAGMAGALLAGEKECDPQRAFDLLRGAVSLHGLAGELAFPAGSRGLIADDLPHFIPSAIKKINPVG
jgi:NAD(P)H-hydrate epimerase